MIYYGIEAVAHKQITQRHKMFEELLKLVGDNAEATALIGTIESKTTSNNDQAKATIDSLTNQFNDIKIEKDKYKAGNALVKEVLGLSLINRDTVSARLKELGTSDSAKDLAKQLSEKETEIQNIRKESDLKMLDFKMDIEADRGLNSVSEHLTDDPLLRDVFRGELRKSIGMNEGQVLPMQTVGDQRIPIMKDGKPLGLVDYASEMLNSDSYKSFRKPTTKTSAGNTGGNYTEGQQVMSRDNFEKLQPTQRAKFMADGGKLN